MPEKSVSMRIRGESPCAERGSLLGRKKDRGGSGYITDYRGVRLKGGGMVVGSGYWESKAEVGGRRTLRSDGRVRLVQGFGFRDRGGSYKWAATASYECKGRDGD